MRIAYEKLLYVLHWPEFMALFASCFAFTKLRVYFNGISQASVFIPMEKSKNCFCSFMKKEAYFSCLIILLNKLRYIFQAFIVHYRSSFTFSSSFEPLEKLPFLFFLVLLQCFVKYVHGRRGPKDSKSKLMFRKVKLQFAFGCVFFS